jgi:hypothetical protein
MITVARILTKFKYCSPSENIIRHSTNNHHHAIGEVLAQGPQFVPDWHAESAAASPSTLEIDAGKYTINPGNKPAATGIQLVALSIRVVLRSGLFPRNLHPIHFAQHWSPQLLECPS